MRRRMPCRICRCLPRGVVTLINMGSRRNTVLCGKKRTPPASYILTGGVGGERGIRTPGASQHGGFQDRCNRPLYHLSLRCFCFAFRVWLTSVLKSGAKVQSFFEIAKLFGNFFILLLWNRGKSCNFAQKWGNEIQNTIAWPWWYADGQWRRDNEMRTVCAW